MNSVLVGAFQNFQISDDLAREHEMIREAEIHVCDQHPAGYFSFIRLKLKSRLLGSDQIHRFKFVWCVRIYHSTRGMSGAAVSEFTEEQGCLTFRYDPMLRAHVAYMYDDKKPALYAKEGQNRDFLASHYETGEFEIEDEDVLDDIQKRLSVLKSTAKTVVTEESEAMTEEQVNEIAKEGLDDEEKRLQESLRLIQERKRKLALDKASEEPTVEEKPKAETKPLKGVRISKKRRTPLVSEA